MVSVEPYPAAALPTQSFHLAALVSAGFIRKVEWRGVTYEVNGSRRVRLLEYRPYQPAAQRSPQTVYDLRTAGEVVREVCGFVN